MELSFWTQILMIDKWDEKFWTGFDEFWELYIFKYNAFLTHVVLLIFAMFTV